MLNAENPNGIEIELSAEEEAQVISEQNADKARKQTELADRQAKADLKASAKAKLIAGEPLTEAEADTLVI